MYISAIVIATLLLIPLQTLALASSSESELFTEEHTQFQRPPLNEDFDPDESRLFNVYQLNAEQECPEDFAGNEDSTFPIHREEGCPEGYFSADDDETGQCYKSDEGGCEDSYTIIGGERFNYILLEGEGQGEGDRCASPSYLCDEEPGRLECKEYLEAKRNQN